MSFSKIISSIAMLAVFGVAALAQGTSLDLRKDGRVLTGDRSNHLIRKVKSYEIKVSDHLRNKLISTVIAAIVIPPDKTVDKYLIGVVPGDGTLPDDWEVSLDDFKLLREWAVNKRLSRVDATNQGLRVASAQGKKELFDAQKAELIAAISGDTSEARMAASYAGYLLQDLPKAMETPELASVVNKYREDEVHSLQPAIVRAVGSNQLAEGTPVLLSESAYSLDASQLSLGMPKRERGANGVSYLTSWFGRSLVIVPEREDMPFNPAKHKSLFAYLVDANPAASKGIVVANTAVKLREQYDGPTPQP